MRQKLQDTTDAIGCQKTIVRQIVRDKGGDYVLALKENQPTLYVEMKEPVQLPNLGLTTRNAAFPLSAAIYQSCFLSATSPCGRP